MRTKNKDSIRNSIGLEIIKMKTNRIKRTRAFGNVDLTCGVNGVELWARLQVATHD